MSWSNILLKDIPPSVYEEALRDAGISATRKKELQKKLNKLIEDNFIGNLEGQKTRTRNLLPTGQILTTDPSNPLYDETEGASPFIRYKIAQELPGVIASILESYESLGKPGIKREKIPVLDDEGNQKKDKYGRPQWKMKGFGQYEFEETKVKPIPVAKRFDLILAQLEYAIEAVLGRLGIDYQPSMSIAEVDKLITDVGLTDEGVADAESKLERILQNTVDLTDKMPKPSEPEQRKLPEGDEDIPSREPVGIPIKGRFDFLNFYKKLERNFEDSVSVRKKDGLVIETKITARAIDTFESDVQVEIAALQDAAGIDLGKDRYKPKVTKPPLDSISQRFKGLNTSEKTKLSCVDYFLTKLAEQKKAGGDVDAKYREIIEDIGVSMYNILVAIYEIEYDDTAVLNFPALLGTKKRIPVKRVVPTFTFVLGGKEYDYSSESAKEIQEIYAEGLRNNLTFSEVRENLTRPQREQREQERKIMAQKQEQFEELLEEIEENRKLQMEYRDKLRAADAQDVASGQKELKDITDSLSNIASAGINIGEVETVADDIEKPVDRTEELNELYNKTVEDLNIKIIPAFGPEEQELSEGIRGTRLPKRARIAAPGRKKLTEEEETQFKERLTSLLETGELTPEETQELRESLLDPNKIPKMKPKYLTQEQYQDIEEQLKDSRNANRKLNAAKRAKAQGRDVKLTRAEINDLENKVLSQKEKTELNNKIKSHLQALVILGSTGGKKRPRNIEETLPKEEIESRKRTYIRDVIDPMSSLRESFNCSSIS